MKHKHYEMIVAKAANMDLVVLIDNGRSDGWLFSSKFNHTNFNEEIDYFLCLPQHKDACLHWLNGGSVQAIHFENQMPDSSVMFDSDFVDVEDVIDTYPWKTNHIFMQEHEIEIKPKKEKRWIGAYSGAEALTTPHYADKSDVVFHINGIGDRGKWQFIEIEVEV